jgi:hypothetical protein
MGNSVSGNAGYFGYHGLLAPGVKLFRSINFPLKSALIVGAMLIPMLGLLATLYSKDAEDINVARSEMQGLVYTVTLTDLMADVGNLRRAATAKSADLNDMKAAVVASFAKVQKVQSDLGKTFNGETNDGFSKLSKAIDSAVQTPVLGTPDETFTMHREVNEKVLALIGVVSDTSQLSLAPNLTPTT